MPTTDRRIRRRFEKRITPDRHIEAVFALKPAKGPAAQGPGSTLGRYMTRYGLTNTLGSHKMLRGQWLVLTEHRVLLFAKLGSGLGSRIGPLEHQIHRTDVEVQWADFTEATLPKRLIHLTTTDQRMNISQTVLRTEEPDRFIQAMADRAREIGLHEL